MLVCVAAAQPLRSLHPFLNLGIRILSVLAAGPKRCSAEVISDPFFFVFRSDEFSASDGSCRKRLGSGRGFSVLCNVVKSSHDFSRAMLFTWLFFWLLVQK